MLSTYCYVAPRIIVEYRSIHPKRIRNNHSMDCFSINQLQQQNTIHSECSKSDIESDIEVIDSVASDTKKFLFGVARSSISIFRTTLKLLALFINTTPIKSCANSEKNEQQHTRTKILDVIMGSFSNKFIIIHLWVWFGVRLIAF